MNRAVRARAEVDAAAGVARPGPLAEVGPEGPGETPVEEPVDGVVEAVVARARTGDERAWRELAAMYGRRIYALVNARVHDAGIAEDVTQSVFATVAAALRDGRYDDRGRFEPWLFRVATNRVRDELRRRRHRARPMGGAEELDRTGTPAGAIGTATRRDGLDGDGLDGDGEMARLRRAVAGLGEADREVIELRHHGGLGFKQIAAVLGEPVGTVLARHHRALAKLRAVLGVSASGLGAGAGDGAGVRGGNER